MGNKLRRFTVKVRWGDKEEVFDTLSCAYVPQGIVCAGLEDGELYFYEDVADLVASNFEESAESLEDFFVGLESKRTDVGEEERRRNIEALRAEAKELRRVAWLVKSGAFRTFWEDENTLTVEVTG